MRAANVYKLSNRFIIHSLTQTKAGSIASPPYLTVDINAPMEDVIKNLIIAMDAGKEGADDLNPDSSLQDHLNNLGMKNKKELYTSLLCSIFERNGVITFVPMVNHGAKGFLGRALKDNVIVPSSASEEELCGALVDTLGKCE